MDRSRDEHWSTPRAYVLGPHDAHEWRAAFDEGRASSQMPFGAEQLRDHGYAVTYSAPFTGRAGRALRRPAGLLQRRSGMPVVEPLVALLHAGRPDLFVTFFEDNGPVLSRLLRWVPLLRPRSSAVVVCWLAERALHAGPRELAAMKRMFAPFDVLITFSRNQRPVLEALLSRPQQQVAVVPFGVAAQAFHTKPDVSAAADWGLSVGGDAGRDYPTLAAATRLSQVPLQVAAPVHRTADVRFPEHVELLGYVAFTDYLQLLQRARFVVVPSHPLAYPTGQTALLEAMAAGKACIATDTPAMRDYVRDEETALLVPPHDPAALADALRRLTSDTSLRRTLGAAAQEAVLSHFTISHMWDAIDQATSPARAVA